MTAAPAVIRTWRYLSAFGAVGQGNVTGTGIPEWRAFQDAANWAATNNGIVEADSFSIGGNNIYEIEQTLEWSMNGSLQMNGCIIKKHSVFTADSTGCVVNLNNLSAAGYGANPGRVRCNFEATSWGDYANGTLSKPPNNPVGAVFNIVSLIGTALVVSGVVGTIVPGQPLYGIGAGGSRGVIPGTWIVSGSGNNWVVSQNHAKAVAAAGTCQGYTTNDTNVSLLNLSNANNIDLDLTLQGGSCGLICSNVNWYTTRFKSLVSYGHSQYGVAFSATNGNSGENIYIDGGVVANCSNSMGIAAAYYSDGTASSDVIVEGDSGDYCDWIGIFHDGDWRFRGHPENCSPNPLFYITTVGAQIKTRFSLDKIEPAFNGFGYSGPASPGGRDALVVLDNGPIFEYDGKTGTYGVPNTALYTTTNGPNTRVTVRGWTEVENNAAPYLGADVNLIANPSFDVSPFPIGWVEDTTTNSKFANLIRNGGMVGAVPGLIGGGLGALPTNWSLVLPTGVTCTVGPINFAEANPQIQLTFAGTPRVGTTIQVLFEGKADIPAVAPQTYYGTVNFAAIGTPTGFNTNCGTFFTGYSAAGATYQEGYNGTQVPNNTQNLTPLPINHALSNAATTTIAFGFSIICAGIGTPIAGTFQFDTPQLGMAGNPFVAPVRIDPAGNLSPIRYYQDTSVTPFSGSHSLAVVSNAANTTWPVAAGGIVNSGSYPGFGTTVKCKPGESLLTSGYVSLAAGAYGIAGFLRQFFDHDGNPVSATSTVGTGVSFPNALATVAAGGLSNGNTIQVAGVTLTAGTDFVVTGNQANDTLSLIAALQAKGAPVNAATFSASTVAGAINITANSYGASSTYTVIGSANIVVTGTASGNVLGPGTGGAASTFGSQVGFVPQQAGGSIAFLGAGIPGDVIDVNGTNVTCVSSGATGNQFNAGTSASQAAANLRAVLSASVDSNISQALYDVASRPAGVVEVTFKSYGTAGNAFTLGYTPATSVNNVILPRAPLVPNGTTSTTLKYGTSWMQCSSKLMVPAGADYCRIYPWISAFQGQANFNFVNSWAT